MQGNCWPNEQHKKLIKAAVFEKDRAFHAWTDWVRDQEKTHAPLDQASRHMFPLIYSNLKSSGISDDFFKVCKTVSQQNWVQQQVWWQRLYPVFEKLFALGERKVIFLKGAAMMGSGCMDFGRRPMGDFDILVTHDALVPVVDILQTQGFVCEDPRFDPRKPWGLLMRNSVGFHSHSHMNLDLHWSLSDEFLDTSIDQKIFEEARLGALNGKAVFVPAPTHLLLGALVHGIETLPVAKLHWVTDSLLILKRYRDELDWDQLVLMAKESKTVLPLKLGLSYLKAHFEASIPDAVLLALEHEPISWFEERELEHYLKGKLLPALWYRYCIRMGCRARWARYFYVPGFLRRTARLRSIVELPIYALTWFARKVSQRVTSLG